MWLDACIFALRWLSHDYKQPTRDKTVIAQSICQTFFLFWFRVCVYLKKGKIRWGKGAYICMYIYINLSNWLYSLTKFPLRKRKALVHSLLLPQPGKKWHPCQALLGHPSQPTLLPVHLHGVLSAINCIPHGSIKSFQYPRIRSSFHMSTRQTNQPKIFSANCFEHLTMYWWVLKLWWVVVCTSKKTKLFLCVSYFWLYLYLSTQLFCMSGRVQLIAFFENKQSLKHVFLSMQKWRKIFLLYWPEVTRTNNVTDRVLK